jgi:hypothetical protein
MNAIVFISGIFSRAVQTDDGGGGQRLDQGPANLRPLMVWLALLSHETSDSLFEACTVERRRSCLKAQFQKLDPSLQDVSRLHDALHGFRSRLRFLSEQPHNHRCQETSKDDNAKKVFQTDINSTRYLRRPK